MTLPRPADIGTAASAGATPAYLPSAARTTAQTGVEVDTTGYRGVRVVVDITAYTAGSLTVTIQSKDPVSGKWSTLLASAALAAAATTALTVYPGSPASANAVAGLPLSREIRAVTAVGDSTSITYSVGLQLLP